MKNQRREMKNQRLDMIKLHNSVYRVPYYGSTCVTCVHVLCNCVLV